MIHRSEVDTLDKILVSHEKNLLRISVSTQMDIREIRLLLDKMADRAENIFIPSEMVKESYGYTFFIRQKRSLKEYLTDNPLSFDQYTQLIKHIIRLKALTDEMEVCLYHVLFDYDTIFLGKDIESLEFLYTPCNKIDIKENAISEMLTILSLYMLEQDEHRSAIETSIRLIADWEAEPSRIFPTEELKRLFQLDSMPNPERKQGWRPFLLFQAGALLLFFAINVILPMEEQGLYFILAWLLLVVCVDFFLVPGLRPGGRRGEHSTEFLCLWVIGPHVFKKYKLGQGGASLRIGRDPQWANLTSDNLLVSRRHAEIYYQEGALFLRDLNSQNGICLNEQKILPEEPIQLQRNNLLSIGNGPQQYHLKFCITRFSLPAMLKYLKKAHT